MSEEPGDEPVTIVVSRDTAEELIQATKAGVWKADLWKRLGEATELALTAAEATDR